MIAYVFFIRKQAFSKDKKENDLTAHMSPWRKLIFASFALSLGASLLMLIISLWFIGLEPVVDYVDKYFFIHFIVVALLFMPVVSKYMK